MSSTTAAATASEPLYQYVPPTELAAWLKDDGKAPTTVVIDVRDKDFVGGHIRGAVNVTKDKFQQEQALDHLIQDTLKGADRVVVHCALSQVRGPAAAGHLSRRLRELSAASPQVFVLQGGFTNFVQHFMGDDQLLEDVNEKMWS